MEALQYCTMYDFRCSTYSGQCEVGSPATAISASTVSSGYNLTNSTLGNQISYIGTAGNNNSIMESMTTVDQLIDPTLEPQVRNRCNTWPLRPAIDPPSVHDSESNHADGAIKEEPEDFHQTELEDGAQSQHNLSGGTESLNISNQLGINNSSELGSQGDLNAKKQSARKNAWGKNSEMLHVHVYLILKCICIEFELK